MIKLTFYRKITLLASTIRVLAKPALHIVEAKCVFFLQNVNFIMRKRRTEKYETRLVQARSSFIGLNVYFTMRKRPQRYACFVLPHLWFPHGKMMFDLNKNASRLDDMRFVENAFAHRRGEKPYSPVKCWFYHEETTVQKVKNAYRADDTQLTLVSCRREAVSLDQM
jgi:hypothetical protein